MFVEGAVGKQVIGMRNMIFFFLKTDTGLPIAFTITINPFFIEFSLFPIKFHRTNRKPFTLFFYHFSKNKESCPGKISDSFFMNGTLIFLLQF